MKFIRTIVLILIALFVVSSCSNGANKPAHIWTVTEGITIRLESGTVPAGAEELVVIYENSTDNLTVNYASGVTIEKYEDGEWHGLKYIHAIGWSDMNKWLSPNSINEHTISQLSILEEPLSSGRYRIRGRPGIDVSSTWNDGITPRDEVEWEPFPPYILEFVVH